MAMGGGARHRPFHLPPSCSFFFPLFCLLLGRRAEEGKEGKGEGVMRNYPAVCLRVKVGTVAFVAFVAFAV